MVSPFPDHPVPMKPIATLTFRLLLCLAIAAPAMAKDTLPTGWVEIGGKRFTVELALDDASREKGLMHRRSMPANNGMLFVHDYTGWLGYWMKNTLLPLDILYFDEQRQLVTQQRDVPPCRSTGNDCPVHPSYAPARYVLELNAGTARQLGLKNGDRLTLGPGIPTIGAGH